MNVFLTFVLLAFAFHGLVLVVFSPDYFLRRELGGKPREDLNTYLRQVGYMKSCRIFLNILGLYVQSLIIEPGYAIWAILSHTAPLYLAYGSLAISLLNMANYFFSAAVFRKRGVYAPITWWYWVQVAVFALPTVYLWFLFARMIGLL